MTPKNYLIVLITCLIFVKLLLFSWKFALIFLFVIPLIFLIIIDYRFGFYLTILTLPFGIAVIGRGLKITFYEIAIILTTISFLIRNSIHKKRIILPNFYAFFFITFGFLLFINTAFFSIDPRKSLLYSMHFIEAFILYFITLFLINERPNEFKRIINIIVVAALIQAIIGIVQHFTGRFGASMLSDRGYLGILHIASGQVWHAAGTFGPFNVLAAFLGTIICILLPYVFDHKERILRAFFLIIFACFIFTYSRGALLGTSAGCLFILYKKLPRKHFIMIFIIFCLMTAMLTVKALSSYGYMKTVGYSGKEGRLEIWQRPWSVISRNCKNFVFGTGSNTYEKVIAYPPDVPLEQRPAWFAHNNYLLLWQEFGLIGLLLHIAFFLFILVRNLFFIKNARDAELNMRIGMFGVVALTMIQSYFDHQFSLTHARNLFFILLALSEANGHLKSLPKHA